MLTLIFSSKSLNIFDWLKHEPLVVGVEMLLLQWCMHRGYTFTWSFPAPPVAVTLKLGNVDFSSRAALELAAADIRLIVTPAEGRRILDPTYAPVNSNISPNIVTVV